MAKSFLLSERDHGRLQKLLRWFDKKVDTRFQRRRRHRGRGGIRVRIAYSKNVAAANVSSFTCFLDTDTTGEEISVTPIVNTTVTAMSLAAPRLFDGTPISVWQQPDGTWRSVVTFEKAGPC